MLQLFAPLAIGFVGSLHCVGMCGPLVLAYSLHMKSAVGGAGTAAVSLSSMSLWRENLLHHMAFHAGRMLTYGFLGALAALIFQAADMSRWLFNVRVSMTLVAGTLLVLFGLVLLRVLPVPALLSSASATSGALLGRRLPDLIHSNRLGSKLALGLATGFLPCGLSWAMIVSAAATQNPVTGFLTMAAFGLGTVPALLLTGVSSSFLSARVRLLGERVAALSVMVMGVMMIVKGIRVLS